MRSCWFNGLYTRLVPSHAIELTAAHLHRNTARIIEWEHLATIDPERRRKLTTVIHLCGAAAAARYAERGFHDDGQHCGSHDITDYVSKVMSLEKRFARLAARG